ncbi:hypothetical protein [Corynebacterium testudinoris]|uniref:Uncharacterized protein n=1 Tax=Corynebacterium testudinoris TaxID=136857 RepID=A0A0G3H949_9CORY|nr:hypothetical protein [Corynebacterium testudinoris]AKK09911.1 hypothetical protein CTEST_12525 [Corynebacterium testudinoris]
MSTPKCPPPDERLSDGTPCQIGIRWPTAVDQLLDVLVKRANEAGTNCNRRELTASLVVESHAMSGVQLRNMLIRYRQAKVGDILPVPNDATTEPARRGSRG